MSGANNTNNGVTTLKVPVYSGKKEDFQMWWFQFTTHATVHGFGDLLVPTKHNDLPDTLAEGSNDTEAQKKMRAKHTTALYHLLLAMGNNQRNVQYVMKTKTNEWPSGLVHKVVEKMQKDHNPEDIASHLESKVKLQQLSLASNEDPQNLFDAITNIQSEHKDVSEVDLIAGLIGALPMEYSQVITNVQLNEGNNLTYEKVENTVTTHYRTLNAMNTGKSEGREIAMNNADTAVANPALLTNPNGNTNPQDWHRLIDQALPPNGWNHQGGNVRWNNQNGHGNWTNANGNGGWNNQQGNGGWNNQNGNGGWNNQNGNGGWNNQNGNGWNQQPTQPNQPRTPRQGGGRYQRRGYNGGGRFQRGRGNGGRGGYGRQPISCYFCQEPHPIRLCPYLPQNPALRPPGGQTMMHNQHMQNANDNGREVANANVNEMDDHLGAEIMMCNVHGDLMPAQDVLSEEIMMCTLNGQLFPTTSALLKDPNIWAADSCSTQNVKTSEEGLTNVVPADTSHNSTNSNGTTTVAKLVGSFPAIQCNRRGEAIQKVTFQQVVVCPNAPFNLLSEGYLHKLGYKVEGDGTYRRFYHPDGREFMFDIIVHTSKGLLFCTYLKPVHTPEISMANITGKQSEVSVGRAHQMFGHMGEDATRKTAAQNGYRITRGGLGVCEPCSISKARRKNLPVGTNLPAKASKEKDRAYVDSATLRRKDKNGKPLAVWVWCLIVFETTGFMLSAMLRKKNQMAGYLCQKFHQFRQLGIMPKFVRMDNAGENVKFQQQAESKDWKLGLTYEYTAPRTPQQNAPVETGLHTLLTGANAMCIAANIPEDKMHIALPKAILTKTKLDGLQPVRLEGMVKTKYEHQFGSNPAFAKYPLPIFGEAMTVTLSQGNKVNSKSKDKGIVAMFTGFPPDHAGNVYEFWEPIKNNNYKSRDWTRLNRMYYPSTINARPLVPTVQPEIVTHYIEVPQANLHATTNQNPQPAAPVVQQVPDPAPEPEVDPVPAPADDEEAAPPQVQIPDIANVVDQVQNPISPVHQPMDRDGEMEDDFAEVQTQQISNTRRSRRLKQQPKRMTATRDGTFHDAFLNSNVDSFDYEISLTSAEEKFYDTMEKYGPEKVAPFVDFLTAEEFMAANVDISFVDTDTDSATDPPSLISASANPPASFFPNLPDDFEITGLDIPEFYLQSPMEVLLPDDLPVVDFTPETFSDCSHCSDNDSVSEDSSASSSEEPPTLVPWDAMPNDQSTASVESSCVASFVSSEKTICLDVLEATETDVGSHRHQNEYFLDIESPFYFFNSEFSCVGAGLGGGFSDTTELHVMTYDEAMSKPERPEWVKSVGREYIRMDKNKVMTPKYIQDIPEHATILTTKWAMKKKASGTYRARMVARGFEQIDGEHYDEHDKASPVVSEITIRIMFVLMLMAGFWAEVVDVCGAFLLGDFEPGHQIYIEVPQGFEKYYPPGVVLLLNKTLYGLKQSAMQFWKLTVRAFKAMGFTRSKADACLQFMWTTAGLLIWITWVDDCLCIGPKEEVLKAKSKLGEFFDTEECGTLEEYIGMKVEWNQANKSLKLTQPVLLQSFQDEFDLPGEEPPNPASQGEILQKGKDDSETVSAKLHKLYRKGVGKLSHMARWTRPEILNRVRELSRFLHAPTQTHINRMYRVMDYVVATALRGWFMQPTGTWDGKDRDFLFKLYGRSDSDYGVDPETRRSVSGGSTFLQDVCICARSRMQSCVTLSVTEAEFVAAVEVAQDMLFAMRVLESMGLKVEKPMILEMDNKGAVDLANNWSAAGRTRHVAVRICFLRELKEEGVLLCKWIPNEKMSSDIYTKNVGGEAFDRHASVYVRE